MSRQVISLLRCFKKKDFTALEKYLQVFQEGQRSLQLFNYLQPLFPHFRDKHLSNEKVKAAISPKKKMTDNALDKIFNALHTAVREFVAVQELREDKVSREQLFMRYTQKRNWLDAYYPALENLKKEIEEKPQTEIWKYQDLIEVYHRMYFDVGAVKLKEKRRALFSEVLSNFDSFYLTYRMLLTIERDNYKYAQLFEIEDIDFTGFMVELKSQGLVRTPFQLCLEKLLKEDWRNDIKQFKLLQEETFDLLDEVRKTEKPILLNFLRIGLALFTREGIEGIFEIEYEIIKKGVEENIYTVNGFMSIATFSVIIVAAARKEDLDWIKEFISDNIDKVLPSDYEDCMRLGEGIIAYLRKDYNQVEQKLKSKPFKNHHQAIYSRLFLLKSYSEYDIEKLHAEGKSMMEHLYRGSLTGGKLKKGVANFINVLKKFNDPDITIEEIEDYVKSTKSLAERYWIGRKIRRIKNGQRE